LEERAIVFGCLVNVNLPAGALSLPLKSCDILQGEWNIWFLFFLYLHINRVLENASIKMKACVLSSMPTPCIHIQCGREKKIPEYFY
jgi:hypothetical protein